MKAKEYTHKEVFPGKEKSGLRLAVFRARQGPWRGFPGSSAGKESACNAGNPGSIPGWERSPGEGIGYPLVFLGLPGGSVSKEPTCKVEDLSSIPGLGRSPEGGHGNPLQYSCLENPMDRGAWWAAAHGSQRVGHNLANKQQRALGRGDRDHLCAKCSILVDLRSLSVTTFGYQVKNHILHLAFFLGFIEASFVSSSCLPFGLCPQ